jgi:alpha-mannosidase
MVTVHMIGNAHIDPVWLWRWPAGVIEVLSTCRSAADLIDANPDFVFTRGEAWVYEQVERHDPELFGRILAHIASGRWKPVGGWYIQSDCNLPLADSFRRQMEIGLRYFEKKLGVRPDVACNVDSFGHAAYLPSLLVEHGYASYVMMRPGPHEKELPGSLFRWRAPDGAEVVTWRIPASYTARGPEEMERNVKAAMAAAAPGIPHVMCFYGVGDHGGGPTQAHIDWIRAHARAFPDAVLEPSDPQRFFAAAAPNADALPVVEGELQYHAIGCYSVVREIKVEVRRAERALARAEAALRMAGARPPARASAALEEAWKGVLFNQFHDTYGGSAVAEAYADARDQLGRSCAIADDLAHAAFLKRLVALPPDPRQRIVAFNWSDRDFDGAIAHEPWLDWREVDGALLDERGEEVPWQPVQQSAIVRGRRAMLWRAKIPARGAAVFRLVPGAPRAAADGSAGSPGPRAVTNGFVTVHAGRGSTLFLASDAAGLPLFGAPGPEVRVLEDSSDTWSHGIDRYAGRRRGLFRVVAAAVEETGPLRATLRVEAAFRSSRLELRLRLISGDPAIHVEASLLWGERLAVAKLAFPFHTPIETRVDGVAGGSLRRPQDGREVPYRDWTLAQPGLGVAAPDCWALDGERAEVRFTLVRSPVFAWHDPQKLDPRQGYRYTDQGEHSYRFALLARASEEGLEAAAAAMTLPPVPLDWTFGMGPVARPAREAVDTRRRSGKSAGRRNVPGGEE